VADSSASSVRTWRRCSAATARRHVVTGDQLAVGIDAGHQLLELQRQQPSVGAQLDDLAGGLVSDAAHHLQALGDDRGVAHGDEVLDLERRQGVGHLVEAGLVALERGDRLIGATQ